MGKLKYGLNIRELLVINWLRFDNNIVTRRMSLFLVDTFEVLSYFQIGQDYVEKEKANKV